MANQNNVYARFFLFAMAFAFSTGAYAQDNFKPENVDHQEPSSSSPTKTKLNRKTLRVGIAPIAPFAMKEGDFAEGFSIDIWRRLGALLEREIEFTFASGVADNLDKVESGVFDVGIGAMSVTHAREKKIDFTHSFFKDGLAMMVQKTSEQSYWEAIEGSMTSTRLTILLGFLLLIVVSGHLIWLAERGKDAFNDNYFPGVFEGMYWAIVTASTVGYGDKAPVKWAGRALAGLVIIISLPMFAVFTAELASAITVQAVTSKIQTPHDLQGKAVAVVKATTSDQYAIQNHFASIACANIDEAVKKLQEGQVTAIIYDAPTLHYYATTRGKGLVHVVGNPFAETDVAFALQQNSPLREDINLALLELQESGEIKRLAQKWFGGSL
ncbi:MAG: transporter substrate-binding domain-containing protein [Deltaproteobacteria bacterium]|nr:transporter substrate-binding domain-containing protein [Deltaproteobacteria bacterium]